MTSLALGAPLLAGGPPGWVAYGLLAVATIGGIYIVSEMSEADSDASNTLNNSDASECTGDCTEEKAKKEEEKIAEMDADSVQKPGDKDFNKDRAGTFDDANKDFDDLVEGNEVDKGNGVRIGKLTDGRTVTVRPNSKSNGPTLDIIKPNGRPFRKYRYPGSPSS
ncbi:MULTISPECIES: hypothetical protein [unclassified Rhizobium]|uniref:hypothetical protein n=1 Tax=unclassified Rhizobium TaxID=2613769 RepID=UPI0017842644|nr:MULTISPECIES: hypothetical protein [unclassified Rhizobium]MBD8688223.1 hypothetical protein [Rhizobium sp. CFBP 13644]MBD8692678.1 hypothetical protein [Rhizobium sp. CFBP 13717]